MPGSIGSQAFSYTVFALNSGLADLVDVAGEVQHLVGEAPLVRRKQSFLRRKRIKKCPKLGHFPMFQIVKSTYYSNRYSNKRENELYNKYIIFLHLVNIFYSLNVNFQSTI